MREAALVMAAVALGGCGSMGVTVTPSGMGPQRPPRAESCNIQFHRTRGPAVPYVELGTIHVAGDVALGPEKAHEGIRSTACRMGGDAVVIVNEAYGVWGGSKVTATVLSFTPTRAPPATP